MCVCVRVLIRVSMRVCVCVWDDVSTLCCSDARCVCVNDVDRWNTKQLLEHSFLNPPPPKPIPQARDSSPEGTAGSAQTHTGKTRELFIEEVLSVYKLI